MNECMTIHVICLQNRAVPSERYGYPN